jgi:single-stranded-DNA-specific exonuclease
MVAKRWILADGESEPVRALSRSLACSPLLARLLHVRGVRDAESAERFLHPKLTQLRDPFELPGMEAAVARIEAAVREKQSIAIFGDYDVDGITSASLLRDFFRLLGVPVRVRLPNRILEGYGLRSDAVEELAREGVRLIVTVDNGSSCVEEVALARTLGIDVVITDHHQCPAELPAAVAIVNPCLPGGGYPFPGLAGVGVTFKLVWALAQRLSRRKKLSEEFRRFCLESLAFVALGTISDVVPLLDENRVLVKYGLMALQKPRKPGLRILVESILRDRGKASIEASDVAFRIAPRLNAAGRLGEAEAAMRLLEAEDESEARSLAAHLERENKRRQGIEQEIHAAARAMVLEDTDLARSRVLVLASRAWHAGVIGIVAARIAEEFHRPTILFAVEDGRARGSARSVNGVHFTHALERCAHLLRGFGGHEMAAGAVIDPERIEDLRRELQGAIDRTPEEMVPEVQVDARVSLSDLNASVLSELALLAPHGRGNPEPVLTAEDIDVVGAPRLIGAQGAHLAFHVRQAGAVFRAVAFGQAEHYPGVSREGARVSLLLEPRENLWQGRRSIELNVLEIRVK